MESLWGGMFDRWPARLGMGRGAGAGLAFPWVRGGAHWVGLHLMAGGDGGLPLGRSVGSHTSVCLQELGVSFGECSAALGHNILEPMVNLAR